MLNRLIQSLFLLFIFFCPGNSYSQSILIFEDFESGDFAAKGWYDGFPDQRTTAEYKNGTHSYAGHFAQGAYSSDGILNTSIVGIQKEEIPFLVYPNPSFGEVNIHFKPGHTGENDHWTLLDVMGRIIQEGAITRTNGYLSLDLYPGFYIFQMTSRSGLQYARQLIVMD